MVPEMVDMSLKTKKLLKGFIQRALHKHNSKFSYDKAIWVNQSTPLTITCPVHGDFEYSPVDHLRTKGCPQCSGRNRLTTPEFIAKATSVHGDFYDYSKVRYKKSHSKVTITCHEHGDFKQTPTNHVALANGCPVCTQNKRLDTSGFITRATSVHGDRYDYRKTKYKGNNTTHVVITCSEHGDFKQAPSNHMSGFGCMKCAREYTRLGGTNCREFEYAGRTFILDSSAEERAIKYLVRKKRIDVDSIITEGDIGYFTVRYRLPSDRLKVVRTYYPDFYIPELHRIVEVKSVATLGLIRSNYGDQYYIFDKVVAKAKACMRLGYKFTLMLIDQKDGNRMRLPTDWYNYTLDDLIDWTFDND